MRSSRRFWIGIDGGGTKTVAALCDERGTVRAMASGGPANVMAVPYAEAEATLSGVVRTLLADAGVQTDELAGVALAVAGADRPEARERLRETFEAVCPLLAVEGDALAALYAGTWGEPGIVLVAGTGSVAYGLSRQGNRCRAGGWGYLLGDEGSGYDLGRRALSAVLRAWDGRGPSTVLAAKLSKAFGVDRPDQLIAPLYGDPQPRTRIAGIAPLVLQAAEEGDPVAEGIVREAAASLAELVEACETRLGEPLPVVLSGGLLHDLAMLARLNRRLAGRRLIVPELPPVAGALVLSFTAAGEPVGEDRRRAITSSWQALNRRG